MGEGVKNCSKRCDVIYGEPLRFYKFHVFHWICLFFSERKMTSRVRWFSVTGVNNGFISSASDISRSRRTLKSLTFARPAKLHRFITYSIIVFIYSLCQILRRDTQCLVTHVCKQLVNWGSVLEWHQAANLTQMWLFCHTQNGCFTYHSYYITPFYCMTSFMNVPLEPPFCVTSFINVPLEHSTLCVECLDTRHLADTNLFDLLFAQQCLARPKRLGKDGWLQD